LKPDKIGATRDLAGKRLQRPIALAAGELGDSPHPVLSSPQPRGKVNDHDLRLTPAGLDESPRPVLVRERRRVGWIERFIWMYFAVLVYVLMLTTAVVIFQPDARQSIVLALITAVVAPFCVAAIGFVRRSRRSKERE
jgi:hypothetical protein